jgi:hypothetical protein
MEPGETLPPPGGRMHDDERRRFCVGELEDQNLRNSMPDTDATADGYESFPPPSAGTTILTDTDLEMAISGDDETTAYKEDENDTSSGLRAFTAKFNAWGPDGKMKVMVKYPTSSSASEVATASQSTSSRTIQTQDVPTRRNKWAKVVSISC